MRRDTELYFEDPMLKLGPGTRLWAKSLKSILSIVAFVAGLIMLFSDIQLIFSLGIFLFSLSLYVSFIHQSLMRRRRFRGGNLLFFMEPEVNKLLEGAMNKSTLLGGSLLLHLLRDIIETEDGEELLKRLDIAKDEFAGQIERYIGEERRLRETRGWKLKRIEELVVRALTTQGNTKRPIAPRDLFRALVYMDNERLQRLFGIFGITEFVMENSYRKNV